MIKVITDVCIVIGVIIAYIIVGVTQPFTNEVIASGNATANWTGVESGQNAYNFMPIAVWFVPGITGIGLIVVNHKLRDS